MSGFSVKPKLNDRVIQCSFEKYETIYSAIPVRLFQVPRRQTLDEKVVKETPTQLAPQRGEVRFKTISKQYVKLLRQYTKYIYCHKLAILRKRKDPKRYISGSNLLHCQVRPRTPPANAANDNGTTLSPARAIKPRGEVCTL